MTTPIAITDFATLDEATREAWLDNLADLRTDAEDIQHHIDELNRTLAYGGITALGLAPDTCPAAIAAATARATPLLAGLDLIGLVGHLGAAIAALQEQLAATQASVFGSRHSEAFATWAATYRPVQANPRPDAPFGGLLSGTLTAVMICLPLGALSVLRPASFGMGDVKLIAVMSLAAGPAVWAPLVAGFGIATGYGLIRARAEGVGPGETALPLAPFLALPGVTFFGEAVLW